MKLYDIKIGIRNGEKTFWRNIGTVFAGDNANLVGGGNKPVTFSIDYPKAQGIVVPRKAKDEDDNSKGETDDLPEELK